MSQSKADLKSPKKRILIQLANGKEVIIDDQDYTRHYWGVGASGDLMVFRSKFHHQFSGAIEEDVRWLCWESRQWSKVTYEDLDESEES